MNEETTNHEKFAEAVRRLSKETIFVPSSADEKIVRSIEEHFKGIALFKMTEEKSRMVISRWQKWMPLAASLLIAAIILYFSRPRTSSDVADLNRDGFVDVLDALILAREVKAGGGSLDLNDDGLTDQQDVRAVAMRAVSMNGGKS